MGNVTKKVFEKPKFGPQLWIFQLLLLAEIPDKKRKVGDSHSLGHSYRNANKYNVTSSGKVIAFGAILIRVHSL